MCLEQAGGAQDKVEQPGEHADGDGGDQRAAEAFDPQARHDATADKQYYPGWQR